MGGPCEMFVQHLNRYEYEWWTTVKSLLKMKDLSYVKLTTYQRMLRRVFNNNLELVSLFTGIRADRLLRIKNISNILNFSSISEYALLVFE